MSILDTGLRSVIRFTVGQGAISDLQAILQVRHNLFNWQVGFSVDESFKDKPLILEKLYQTKGDSIVFLSRARGWQRPQSDVCSNAEDA